MSEIDFGPVLVDAVIPALSAVLLALGSVAVRWLSKRLKLEADAEVRRYLEAALERGVRYGAAKATELARNHGTVAVRNTAVAQAAQYVLDQVPDALRHFGITPERLERMIEARLAGGDRPSPGDPATPGSTP